MLFVTAGIVLKKRCVNSTQLQPLQLSFKPLRWWSILNLTLAFCRSNFSLNTPGKTWKKLAKPFLRRLWPLPTLLRSGVNFTNVLHAAFTLVDPESVKKYSKVISIFFAAFSLEDPESVKNTVKSSVSFYTFRICARKSCM